MSYYLIGEKLSHSFSKTIHSYLGNENYNLLEIDKHNFINFISSKNYNGLNVTIPYKREILSLIDVSSQTVAETGTVNTVVNKNGTLYGYNTDAFGLECLIKRVIHSLEGLNVLILGTGGTAHTAYYVSNKLGAKSVIYGTRGTGNDIDVLSYDKIDKSRINFIINTTPCGMYPSRINSPINVFDFNNLIGVIDAVYNPLKSDLIIKSEKVGIKCQGGLYMLIAQAVMSDALFFDKTFDYLLCDNLYKTVLNKKRNIVLIGMPSCGKTTVGKAVASKLGMNFIDTDEEIEKHCSIKISDIFSKFGEEYFRQKETEIIENISYNHNFTVIATGGGSVLRANNVDALKSNGIIVYIKRDLSKLVPTDDRPLSRDNDAVSRLYNERKELYESSCNIIIDGNATIEEVCNRITERISNYD